MANWCTNEFTVAGRTVDVEAFEEAVRGGGDVPLSFESLMPTPGHLLSPDGNHLSDGGVDWRNNNWGTHAELDEDTSVTRSPRRTVYLFTTAWTPPIPWVREASTRFPKLRMTLTWAESGERLHGLVVLRDGEEVCPTGRELLRARDLWLPCFE